jgi:hypothetical protein
MDTTIRIPMRELGNYEYAIVADSIREPANRHFSVSRLATVSRAIDGKSEYLVVDRMTGKPLQGAEVRFYSQKDNAVVRFERKLATDKNGLAMNDDGKNLNFYHAVFGNDTALVLSSVPWIPTWRENVTNDIQVNLFTDRSLYRPGQTVYFKGVVFEPGEKVVPNKTCKLGFEDANGKEIAAQTVRSNEFGSFQGEFVIPQGSLNGSFSIRSDVGGGYAFVQVEEYKRPTFDILFEPNREAFRLGDTVTVKGTVKTFSGVPLQDTQVRYKIARRSRWGLRMSYFRLFGLDESSVQTQSDGSFLVRFPTGKTPDDRNSPDVYYVYEIEATVTGANGETQTAVTSLSMGDKSLLLLIDGCPDVVEKEKEEPSLTIRAMNLAGEAVPTQGRLEIYRLKAKDPTILAADTGNWTPAGRMAHYDFVSGQPISAGDVRNFPSGRYRIRAWASDASGREVKTQQDFTLASASDKRPPAPVYEWLMTPKTVCAVGETAEIIYGSSAKQVHVLYELFKADRRISVARFVLNNENRKIEIPFLESYGEGITASFSFVKDGKFFARKVYLGKKQEKKTLNLKMEVFRDRLLPGQTEEWKLSAKDAEQNPVVAELLAAMYDASLDKIRAHDWHFNPARPAGRSIPANHTGYEWMTSSKDIYKDYPDAAIPNLGYTDFNWFGFAVRNSARYALMSKLRSKAAGVVADIAATEMESQPTIFNHITPDFKGSSSVMPANYEEAQTGRESAVTPRQNFNETAFFYPQLKTDEAGETLISFTLPESNTTWKFMGMAHTKDLKFGQIVQTVVSQKQLMISPNIPRFLRTGDRATIVSAIANLTDKTLSGTATIDFPDPVTHQPVIAVADRSLPFSVEPGQTVPVSWSFDVPDSLKITAVRIVAASSDFSDGEQRLLPVLPHRMLVTESLPLYVSGGQTRTFPLTPLFGKTSPTLEDDGLILELTDRPIWYAVQALPSVSMPQTDNVLSWFTAYYIHAMAARIANSTPAVRSMIELWTKQGSSSETLLSQLEKNQELKTVVLEETPWVVEAENESAQKQRLVSLFDANRIRYMNEQALEKLQSLQTGDGGWSWFKGMNSSASITQWILYGMAAIRPEGNGEMIEKAVRFIDKQFKKQYEDFKKNNLRWKESQSFSTDALEYLLVRSYYPDIPFGDADEAVRFYAGLVEKYWVGHPDLYGRALAALILQRNGRTSTAQAILRSLREHASRQPDLGMYWANNHTHSFMTQSAVCVHTFIMEAFRETGSTPAEMDEMKLWLLKQKQTQAWESVPATVNAIDMLLKTGGDWLLESSEDLTVRLGGRLLDLGEAEPGTGYRKVFNALTDGKPLKQESLTLAKKDAGPAWGALYRRYFEDLDQITASQTGFSVDKSFVTPPDRPLRVGDKLTVRLIVRTDRDREFVHLKDLRASCFEPVSSFSGVQWKQGLTYYQSSKDASMNFFFPALPKGTYVFEYEVYVTAPGNYSSGIATLQCMYAPEFVSHTAGGRIEVQ